MLPTAFYSDQLVCRDGEHAINLDLCAQCSKCEEMGIETGYDLDKLIETAIIAEEVVGHALWGHVSKSGPRPRDNRRYPKDIPFVETLEEAAHFRKGPSVYAQQLSPWEKGASLFH